MKLPNALMEKKKKKRKILGYIGIKAGRKVKFNRVHIRYKDIH